MSFFPKTKVDLGLAILSYDVSSGTDYSGALALTTWTQLALNTTIIDSIGVQLGSNQFKLYNGTYNIRALQVFDVNNAFIPFMLRIRNITDSTTGLSGMSEIVGSGTTTTPGYNSLLEGELVVTGGLKTFELEYWAGAGAGAGSLGKNVGSGEVERYTQLTIRRMRLG